MKIKSETVEYRLEEFLRNSFGREFVDNKKVISISCLQFGDTGKGKFVDLFAKWADIIVRPTGGNNAGHTIIYKGKELVLHLAPCGITDPNKINVVGSGVVIDPIAFVKEILFLQSQGFSCDNLRISLKAKVILPSHVLLDRIKEAKAGKARIGSTGKGIEPCYTDHISRRGITMNDLLNPASFRCKLKKALDYHTMIIRELGGFEAAREILKADDLGKGKFIGRDELFDFEAITKVYLECAEQLKGIIEDTDEFVRQNLGKKNILLEGAQGYLLSVDYGTYPFVTSSDCSPAGMAKGAGLRESNINLSFGIIKGFIETRVGKGSFPTEGGGSDSEIWCNEIGSRDREKEMFTYASINDSNPFFQGMALRRLKGSNEYGATTGRPRRIGWLDLVLLRYALDGGANNIIMTKLDILSGVDKIQICDAYKYVGPDYNYGNKVIKEGDIITKIIPIPEILDYCEPIYKEFIGWKEIISAARKADQLPENLLNILREIFSHSNILAAPRIISVGPDAEETVFLNPGDLN